MTDEPDLDMAMTRLLAEIAGVLNEAAGLRADLAAQRVPQRADAHPTCHAMAREKSATVINVVRFFTIVLMSSAISSPIITPRSVASKASCPIVCVVSGNSTVRSTPLY